LVEDEYDVNDNDDYDKLKYIDVDALQLMMTVMSEWNLPSWKISSKTCALLLKHKSRAKYWRESKLNQMALAINQKMRQCSLLRPLKL
jgi:hypothetical protein